MTVFRLRKMLIEAGLPEYEYIVKEKGVFYWRSPMKVDLDVARFMELVREGEEEVDDHLVVVSCNDGKLSQLRA